MFLRKLTIKNADGVIRELNFTQGVNLVIDDTPVAELRASGNNVGKTTVLRLIDFCLGGDQKLIYTDSEDTGKSYVKVQNFLIEKNVHVLLELSESLDGAGSGSVVIERNFLPHNKGKVLLLNHDAYKSEKEFKRALSEKLFPGKDPDQDPTVRQLISHNMRFHQWNIEKTLETLHPGTDSLAYESLYLYMFGCFFEEGKEKKKLASLLKTEEQYRIKLTANEPLEVFVNHLKQIDGQIERLKIRKNNLNYNPDYEAELEELTRIKQNVGKSSQEVGLLQMRLSFYQSTIDSLRKDRCQCDFDKLKTLYRDIQRFAPHIQKTFEDMVEYHNQMLEERERFIIQNVEELESKLGEARIKLKEFLAKEKELSQRLSKSNVFDELSAVMDALNENYRNKGGMEKIIEQISESEARSQDLRDKLDAINGYLQSKEFEQKLDQQLDKFNEWYSEISQILYSQVYSVYKTVQDTKSGKRYVFGSFNGNIGSGKKQGEILCFDIAYILFADQEKIPCLHFLLNDKKELMDDHQLNTVTDYIADKNVQLVFSILKDKLPPEVLNKAHTVVELSQASRLFRIEELEQI